MLLHCHDRLAGICHFFESQSGKTDLATVWHGPRRIPIMGYALLFFVHYTKAWYEISGRSFHPDLASLPQQLI